MAGRRRFKLLVSLLLVFALLFGSTSAEAQSPTIPVIVKLGPLSSVARVLSTLTGGTLIDTIPGSGIVLINVPNLPLVQSLLATPQLLLNLLGIDWLELNTGVAEPGHVQAGILQAGGAADWYKDQPAFAKIRAGSARQYSTGRGI